MKRVIRIVPKALEIYSKTNLVVKISIGLIIGIILGIFFKHLQIVSMMGDLFVGALKAIAPVLVFALVSSALAQGDKKPDQKFGLVILLYLVSTFLAAVTAVVTSFIFPQTLVLSGSYETDLVPSGVGAVLKNLLLRNLRFCQHLKFSYPCSYSTITKFIHNILRILQMF